MLSGHEKLVVGLRHCLYVYNVGVPVFCYGTLSSFKSIRFNVTTAYGHAKNMGVTEKHRLFNNYISPLDNGPDSNCIDVLLFSFYKVFL